MAIEAAFNFRRINDHVTTSGFVTDAQVKDLKLEGYDAVINLLPNDHDQALAGEAAIVREQGLEYVYIPVDFDAPTLADLEAFVGAMEARDHLNVHVHCAANYRVSIFYSLYAQRKGWWSSAAGNEFVRGIWNPVEHPGWDALIAAATATPQGSP